jgi:hypothetical protein
VSEITAKGWKKKQRRREQVGITASAAYQVYVSLEEHGMSEPRVAIQFGGGQGLPASLPALEAQHSKAERTYSVQEWHTIVTASRCRVVAIPA